MNNLAVLEKSMSIAFNHLKINYMESTSLKRQAAFTMMLELVGFSPESSDLDKKYLINVQKEVLIYSSEKVLPWCMTFMMFVLKNSGLNYLPSAHALDLPHCSTKVTEPVIGDVALFHRGNPESLEGHVGFFIKDLGNHISILSADWSNSVGFGKEPKSSLIGYYRPYSY